MLCEVPLHPEGLPASVYSCYAALISLSATPRCLLTGHPIGHFCAIRCCCCWGQFWPDLLCLWHTRLWPIVLIKASMPVLQDSMLWKLPLYLSCLQHTVQQDLHAQIIDEMAVAKFCADAGH